MSKNYVFSTLACNQLYTNWRVSDVTGQDPIHVGEVLVLGGAGVANSKNWLTPQGVVTEVTDEQLALLEENHDFKRHKSNGFITVKNRNADVDKVASDMSSSDKSRPFTSKSPEFNQEKIIEA